MFVARAPTERGYQLHDLGAYPGLAAGGRGSVAGEVYELNQAELARVDAFEGAGYRRQHIRLAGGEVVFAYLLAAPSDGPLIPNGDYAAWRAGAVTMPARPRSAARLTTPPGKKA